MGRGDRLTFELTFGAGLGHGFSDVQMVQLLANAGEVVGAAFAVSDAGEDDALL